MVMEAVIMETIIIETNDMETMVMENNDNGNSGNLEMLCVKKGENCC